MAMDGVKFGLRASAIPSGQVSILGIPMRNIFRTVQAGVVAACFFLSTDGFALPAFPGAEGFGASSIGGRGGRVCTVTNLNDSGPGSLRSCLLMTGARIVVFRMGGTINLLSDIEVVEPFLTIAGCSQRGYASN